MPVTDQWSLPHLILSGSLFVVLIVVIWTKMHRLRMEIHTLIENLPRMGSEFIHKEVSELRDEVREARARISICEGELGLNGEDRRG